MTHPDDVVLRDALAAIAGLEVEDIEAEYADQYEPDDQPARADQVQHLLARISTRLGLAPAVDPDHAEELRTRLGSVTALTRGDLATWDRLLRHTPESIPTLEGPPVTFPPLPEHQHRMWHTILDLDRLDTPWVLVGGQMTVLHCLEHGALVHRATDDGDIVVGVWTRRDALDTTTTALRELGYTEQRTHDGYGYRFHRDQTTVVDVLLPEGMDRRRQHPTTGSGRPGLATEGGRQALSRTERVPVEIHGRQGHVRRPTLLGALVAKAHARAVDSRDPDRHTEDIVVLAELALAKPRAVLAPLRPSDRRALRRIRHRIDERQLAMAQDPVAVGNLLDQMAGV